MLKKNKKGISHIEVILSFVIFIGFLIFVLGVFKPFKGTGNGEAYLDVLERSIKGYSNVDINFLTLKLDDDVSVDKCFRFKYNSSLQNISVKNESYDFVGAFSEKKQGDSGNEEKEIKIYINSTGKFFYIYISDEFNKSEPELKNAGCLELKRDDYTFGLFRSYKMSSYNRFGKLEEDYYSSYDDTKSNFGLPSSKDFLFNIRNTTGENILGVARKIPKGVNILAKDVPVQLVYANGTLQYAILNIKVW